jgi:hypothetical protein
MSVFCGDSRTGVLNILRPEATFTYWLTGCQITDEQFIET